MKIAVRIGAMLLAGTACLLADVSYQESVKYTGGSLIDMMKSMNNGVMGKMMGGRMGKALQDQTYKVYLKGNKMVRLGADTSIIFDLDAGTMTTIDNQKQSYSTMTFDEMNQRMQEMKERMSKKDSQTPEIQFDSKAEPTGKTRTIDGQDAKEYVMTITAQGQQGGMHVKSDLWAVSSVAGMEELRAFQTKMAAKLNNMNGGLNPMMGTASSGLNQLSKETLKMDGYPVTQEVTVSGVQSPMSPMMAMRNGGQENSDPNAPFLIMNTESNSFSNGTVSDSVFQIPAGYKEQKGRRR
jgi:hypothetical protein